MLFVNCMECLLCQQPFCHRRTVLRARGMRGEREGGGVARQRAGDKSISNLRRAFCLRGGQGIEILCGSIPLPYARYFIHGEYRAGGDTLSSLSFRSWSAVVIHFHGCRIRTYNYIKHGMVIWTTIYMHHPYGDHH